MSWILQTPGSTNPNLLTSIVGECVFASRGGAAFAFASATGVKLLFAEPDFKKFIATAHFTAVVGLDAITDTSAVDELRKVHAANPNFNAKLFLNGKSGSLFHPKTIWLSGKEGGAIITGSGNLTAGGLKSNWEAMAVEKLDLAQMTEAEKSWEAWLDAHKEQLKDLDDAGALEKAAANKIQRSKLKKTMKLAGKDDDEVIDAIEQDLDEIDQELALSPVLIAEVPRSGNRWRQVNFDLHSYQQFFGVKLGNDKAVQFYNVKSDGSFDAAEQRNAVAVKSQNYRFEVGAANGLDYPAKGHPIVIFEKITDADFKYILLMPETPAHSLIQQYLDDNYTKSKKKLRVILTAGELKEIWPASPLFM